MVCIIANKRGAANTKSSQACDLGKYFLTLTSQIYKLAMKDDVSSLKQRIKQLLNGCKEFNSHNKQRRNDMIDATVCL